MSELLTTPLNAAHRRLGARMVPFGGWDMPVQYAGISEEHAAVRNAVGIFDVSHMGEFFVDGPGAETLLMRLTPNDTSKLVPGRAHYTAFLTEAGTFVDDLIVYKRTEDSFMIVANASNASKDFAWLAAGLERLRPSLPGPVTIRDASKEVALLAVQGPKAVDLMKEAWTGGDASALKYYGFGEGGLVAGQSVIIVSRTGYTGEDGFEIYVDAARAEAVWNYFIEKGVAPIGLGARDTLRLEAAMCLYGNDIDDATTPIEAGLAWTVKMQKAPFTGCDVLAAQIEAGTSRRLVGLEMCGVGIARHGHSVLHDGQIVGSVTSGTKGPTLGKAIALAYVPTRLAEPGTALEVDVRGKIHGAHVVALPFYSRKRK